MDPFEKIIKEIPFNQHSEQFIVSLEKMNEITALVEKLQLENETFKKNNVEISDNEQRYQKVLYALLSIAVDEDQDRVINVIKDALQGHSLMERYHQDFLHGVEVMQHIEDKK